ncbi:hypothetical protein LCGC14_2163460 [marine sediment metagenome]|uniref:Uncharacterized protein n=1 Tax=marine sediment metagenome TaxID=412755 RepID=A0A0F9DS53_9ZZZZ
MPKYDKQHIRKVNQLKADGKLKKRIEHKVPDVNTKMTGTEKPAGSVRLYPMRRP